MNLTPLISPLISREAITHSFAPDALKQQLFEKTDNYCAEQNLEVVQQNAAAAAELRM
ncbi:MAG: hypothetical protein QNK11_06895 [Legionella sp.]|nr:hypothetical protein [Legionella sp.]